MNPSNDSSQPVNLQSAASERSPAMPAGASSLPAGMAAAGSNPPKLSRRRTLLASIVIGAIVLIGGASAAAYFSYIMPNEPQNILNAALLNQFSAGKVSSQSVHGTYQVKSDGETMRGTFKGAAHKDGVFDLNATLNAGETGGAKLTLDLRSPDAQDLYLRAGGVGAFAQALAGSEGASGDSETSLAVLYGSLLDSVDNKWIVIDESLIRQYAGAGQQDLKLSDEDMRKVGEAYKQNQFLIAKERLGDETISGKNSTHLKVIVDKQELKDFMAAVKASGVLGSGLSDDNLKEFNAEADKTDFTKHPLDVWVSKADKLINQVSFTMDSDGTSVSLTATVDDWNKGVKVERPAAAVGLEELLTLLYDGSDVDSLLTLPTDSGVSL